jgi:hypothetical protein
MKAAPDFLHRAATIMEERGKQYDKPGGEAKNNRIIQALTVGIPLTEPVHIEKALLAQEEAKVVLNNGVGPLATVHLVNVGLTGWIHTKETAEAYAKGYNTAIKQYRAALVNLAVPEEKKKNMKNTADELLGSAASIMQERANQYDKPSGERSMAKTVAAFNAITGRDLSEQEGWEFMMVLKSVRFFSNTTAPHRDSLEDAIAYSALLAESALKGE